MAVAIIFLKYREKENTLPIHTVIHSMYNMKIQTSSTENTFNFRHSDMELLRTS